MRIKVLLLAGAATSVVGLSQPGAALDSPSLRLAQQQPGAAEKPDAPSRPARPAPPPPQHAPAAPQQQRPPAAPAPQQPPAAQPQRPPVAPPQAPAPQNRPPEHREPQLRPNQPPAPQSPRQDLRQNQPRPPEGQPKALPQDPRPVPPRQDQGQDQKQDRNQGQNQNRSATPPAPQTQPQVPPRQQQGAPQPPAGMPAPAQPNRTEDRPRRLDDIRGERREIREGNRIVIQEGSRAIVRDGDRRFIRHDESERFRRFGRDVNVQRVGNETRTVMVGPNGSRVVTVTDPNGRLLRRSRFVDNREVVLIDNRPRGGRSADALFVALPALALATLAIPRERYIVEAESAPPEYIYDALIAPPVERLPRTYTLDEIRYSPQLRDRMPRIDLDTVTFDTGSWEIRPDQYNRLAPIAEGIRRAIAHNPNEVFLIEGHTDAVGNEDDNLSLSDRRAEAVSVVLTDQFRIPPENLATQGYGEQQLKVPTQGPERANRRVTVRRITPLLQQGAN